jgi:hypothetical protein
MSINNILQNAPAIPLEKVRGKYLAPSISRISLDNEISLQLESPPVLPNEGRVIAPEYFNTDPFKSNRA